jgi:hypothetical protein
MTLGSMPLFYGVCARGAVGSSFFDVPRNDGLIF